MPTCLISRRTGRSSGKTVTESGSSKLGDDVMLDAIVGNRKEH